MENNNISSPATNKALFSFINNPRINFETHEPTEKIILMIRNHPFTQMYWIANAILIFFLFMFVNSIIVSFLTAGQLFFINIFFFMCIISYIWFNFLNWYFNVGIITNKRIIDIDFSNILYKEITVAQLDKIQDVTIKSGGYTEAFFDYGTIYIQTAGSENYIEFLDIPYPGEVVNTINKLLARRHGH